MMTKSEEALHELRLTIIELEHRLKRYGFVSPGRPDRRIDDEEIAEQALQLHNDASALVNRLICKYEPRGPRADG